MAALLSGPSWSTELGARHWILGLNPPTALLSSAQGAAGTKPSGGSWDWNHGLTSGLTHTLLHYAQHPPVPGRAHTCVCSAGRGTQRGCPSQTSPCLMFPDSGVASVARKGCLGSFSLLPVDLGSPTYCTPPLMRMTVFTAWGGEMLREGPPGPG